jgi:hypothetical protein
LCREIFYFPEFRHKGERTIQLKPAPMIPAGQLMRITRLIHQDVASVCADIGQTMELLLMVSGEDQGLIEIPFKQSEWHHSTRLCDLVAISNKLP